MLISFQTSFTARKRKNNLQQNMCKNFHYTLYVSLHYLASGKMLMFENDTNCAEIIIKFYPVKISYMFNHLLTLFQNLLKISSFNLIGAHRCVCHSLIAGRVSFCLSAGQHSHTHSPLHTVWFLEQAT